MKKGLPYNKFAIALLLVLVGHIAFGTGITEKSNSSTKFTIKNLNKNKNLTLSTNLNSNYKFKGSQFLNVKKSSNNTVQVSTVIRYQNGNTTYVYPYKYKVKAPRFKTPAPAVH
ncbi:MAG: hypothetical protein K0Q66_998 [Chitinophagaceae bacterium]|jgi:hypothetical protein|nr:hypothetical protein [Chitinophagaceae bacterium]